ncbi:MAG: ABC transporter ATP-binding protein [Phycisphaeraceae bacterium]|nr:ABC transporter ATP-binding protein [Phycisphaeraceae bacterium]
MTVIELDNVGRYYATTAGASITVLDSISLRILCGDALAIIGPSGCGKSTLLNLMGALDQASAGRVMIDGRDVAGLDDRQRAKLRNERIGFVFQAHHLLPQCTVLENVLVPTLVRGASSADLARAEQLLDDMGLADRRHHRPGQLSGGECQRVAVIRAMINQPAVLLADEPTGSLDHANASRLVELMVKLNKQEQCALIMVTHSVELALRLGEVRELRDGRLHPWRGGP